jgi:hypothetical protein
VRKKTTEPLGNDDKDTLHQMETRQQLGLPHGESELDTDEEGEYLTTTHQTTATTDANGRG